MAHLNSVALGYHNRHSRQGQEAVINGIVTIQMRYRQNQNHNIIGLITSRGAIITRTSNIIVIITIKRAIITNNIIVFIRTKRAIITKTNKIVTRGSPLRATVAAACFFSVAVTIDAGTAITIDAPVAAQLIWDHRDP
ncbi:hypothetical protein PG984_004960 [Apiospora sp. TS-2023a]